MSMRVETLARQLLADRARARNRPSVERVRPPGSDLDPYPVVWESAAGADAGYLPQTPMRKGPVGFYVPCKACGTQFESKGLAYCEVCLKIPAEERRLMKPAVTGRMCQAPGCENRISRETRGGTRFCSKACKHRAWRESRRDRGSATDNP